MGCKGSEVRVFSPRHDKTTCSFCRLSFLLPPPPDSPQSVHNHRMKNNRIGLEHQVLFIHAVIGRLAIWIILSLCYSLLIYGYFLIKPGFYYEKQIIVYLISNKELIYKVLCLLYMCNQQYHGENNWREKICKPITGYQWDLEDYSKKTQIQSP